MSVCVEQLCKLLEVFRTYLISYTGSIHVNVLESGQRQTHRQIPGQKQFLESRLACKA